jgi:hypothetical protein
MYAGRRLVSDLVVAGEVEETCVIWLWPEKKWRRRIRSSRRRSGGGRGEEEEKTGDGDADGDDDMMMVTLMRTDG